MFYAIVVFDSTPTTLTQAFLVFCWRVTEGKLAFSAHSRETLAQPEKFKSRTVVNCGKSFLPPLKSNYTGK